MRHDLVHGISHTYVNAYSVVAVPVYCTAVFSNQEVNIHLVSYRDTSITLTSPIHTVNFILLFLFLEKAEMMRKNVR